MVSIVTNSIPTYNNSPISSKIDRTIVIQTEFIKALKEHGCPSCLEILKQVVEKYVGPSLPTASNLKTELDVNHGNCRCCTPIPKPITTCPLKIDKLKSKPRGRPRMKGAV